MIRAYIDKYIEYFYRMGLLDNKKIDYDIEYIEDVVNIKPLNEYTAEMFNIFGDSEVSAEDLKI